MEQPKLCECGCGHPAPIATGNRKNRGIVKGQPLRYIRGHYKREPVLFVEVGQRFGGCIVLDADIRVPRHGRVKTIRAAKLRCHCGAEFVRTLSALLAWENPSCGCVNGRFMDRMGQRFGKLVVIQRLENVPNGGGTRWLCRCDCGTEIPATGSSLSAGHTQSCGCKRRRPKTGYLPGEASKNKVLLGYKQGAQSRGYDWDLPDEDFFRLIVLDCFYCGAPPSCTLIASPNSGEFTYNGLDRRDNSKGYVLENVVTCCKICNHAKKDLTFDDFMAWIARLAKYYFFHPN